MAEKILPPWVTFPNINPFDFFWREAREPWLHYIWSPFWITMTKEEQIAYLDTWNAPKDWRYYYSEDWQSILYDDEYN